MELSIHEVGHSARYPDGVKYGLLMVDLQTGKKVLMDNHHPKDTTFTSTRRNVRMSTAAMIS